jgi:hypothetical protein
MTTPVDWGTPEPTPRHLLPDPELAMKVLLRVKARIERGGTPPSLALPEDKAGFPKALLLDSNKWIELSRAHHQRPNSAQFLPALRAIRTSAAAGRLVVPMTSVNIEEAAKGRDEQRRRRLAEFMVDLSRNFSTRAISELEEAEIDRAIRVLIFERPPRLPLRSTLLRYGARTIYTTDITPIETPDPRIARACAEVALEPEMTIMSIVGHNHGERFQAALQRDGELGRDRLAAIREIDKNLQPDEKLRRERRSSLRAPQFVELLHRRLLANSVPLAGFYRWVDADENLAAFFDELPSFVVPSVLMFGRDRNTNDPNKVNDAEDYYFLRAAIPYSNFVVTENRWAHIAKAGGLDTRYDTTIVASLEDLPEVLQRASC